MSRANVIHHTSRRGPDDHYYEINEKLLRTFLNSLASVCVHLPLFADFASAMSLEMSLAASDWTGVRYHCRGVAMSTEELESEALKLSPRDRARLAERLLHSLENLTDEENARLWTEEAERRDATWDEAIARQAGDVLRDARARLK